MPGSQPRRGRRLRVSTRGTNAVRRRIARLIALAALIRDAAVRAHDAGRRNDLFQRIVGLAHAIPSRMAEAYARLDTNLEREQVYVLYMACHERLWDIAESIGGVQ